MVVAASLAIGTGAAVWSGTAAGDQHTAKVQRGSVSLGTQTVGALATAKTANLSFEQLARLAAVYVNVGDTVKRGQLLAKQDTFLRDQALRDAQTQLALTRTQLTQSLDDPRIKESRKILRRDRAVADAHKHSLDVQHRNDEINIRHAEQIYRFQVRTLRQDCDHTTGPTLTGSTTLTSTDNQTCNQDRLQVLQARQAIENAREIERSDIAAGVGLVRSDRVTLAFDQAAIEVELKNRPAQVASARAAVEKQQSTLAAAQHDLDTATLRAPVDGTVAAITGAPGEVVGGPALPTPLAPGGRAQLPGAGRNPISPGLAFIELKPTQAFQMVVPLGQAAVAQVKVDQRVQVHPDAFPALSLPGTVLAVAPSPVDLNGPSYYATIMLDQNDPRLRDGMTTTAQITSGTLDNVLVVPSSAVVKRGTATFVNLIRPDGSTVLTPFTAGQEGYDNTQVLSGLTEGQMVQIP
jgi:HlyD family secretion protein